MPVDQLDCVYGPRSEWGKEELFSGNVTGYRTVMEEISGTIKSGRNYLLLYVSIFLNSCCVYINYFKFVLTVFLFYV